MSYISKIQASCKPSVLKYVAKNEGQDALAKKNPEVAKNMGVTKLQDGTPLAKKKKGLKSACWKGYEAIGMKKKGGRKVPNCVPKKK